MLSKPGQGYLNSGLTSEKAKAAIEEVTGKKRPPTSGDAIVFSRGVRRTFEAATNVSEGRQTLNHIRLISQILKVKMTCRIKNLLILYGLPQECKRSNVTYISPEHILLALLSMPDSIAVKVMER